MTRGLLIILPLTFATHAMANRRPDGRDHILRRAHFNYNMEQGTISYGSHAAPDLYEMGKLESVSHTGNWSSLNRRHVVKSEDGENPYRLEVHSSSTNNQDFVIIEGAADEERRGKGRAEVIVTEVRGGDLKARTRCESKYVDVENTPDNGLVAFFDTNPSQPGPQAKSRRRDLMDCKTVTKEFCNQFNGGIKRRFGEKIKNCTNAFREILSKRNKAFKELQAKENDLANTWLKPFSNNFYGNVNQKNIPGSTTTITGDQMLKTIEKTENNLHSIVDVIQGCDVFNKDESPISEVNPVAGAATQAEPARTEASQKQ